MFFLGMFSLAFFMVRVAFIVAHQASEAWFKVILHELDGPVAALSHDDPAGRSWRSLA
jgi:tryptophan 2,3-dioxygenase